MREVAIIGVGMTDFGELWQTPLRNLYAEAVASCLKDAGIERDQIQSAWMGCMSSGLFNHQEHLASILSDYAGLNGIAATRVESACASGGAAFRAAYLEVASGASDFVIASGVEKMNDGADATFCLATAADQEYEVYHGVTFPGLYAMIATAHMHKHGTTYDMLCQVAVKNHKHGAMNPKAQFPMEITMDTVRNAVRVSEPLGLFDCSPVTDGAAAVLLAPVEVAKALGKPLVTIKGSGHAVDSIALHDRPDPSRIPSVGMAARKAFERALRYGTSISAKSTTVSPSPNCAASKRSVSTKPDRPAPRPWRVKPLWAARYRSTLRVDSRARAIPSARRASVRSWKSTNNSQASAVTGR